MIRIIVCLSQILAFPALKRNKDLECLGKLRGLGVLILCLSPDSPAAETASHASMRVYAVTFDCFAEATESHRGKMSNNTHT